MIKQDRKNYRKHSDKNKKLINKSLLDCGAGRSILVDSEDEIIAGNGVFEQAKKLNLPVKVIETDGSELVVVKRMDLKPEDKKRQKLAVMDNSTNDTSDFDFDLLKEDFAFDELEEMGLPDIMGGGLLDSLDDDVFSKHLANESDVFSISFNFEKEDEALIKEIVKKVGKEALTAEIRNLIVSKNNA